MIRALFIVVIILFFGSSYAQFPYFEKVIGAPGHVSWGDNITATNDGNYLVGGYDSNAGIRMHAMKFDLFGNVIWDYRYSDPAAPGGLGAEAYTALDDAAGNTYIVGHQDYSFGSPGYSGDIVLIKMDPAGTVVYSKRYNNGVNASSNGYHAIIDASFITIVGAVNDGNADAAVIRVDIATGNVVWMQRYDLGGFEYGWNIEQAGANLYIMGTSGAFSGASGSPFLMEIDAASGAVNWCQTYTSANADWFTGLEVLSGGGFVLAGVRSGDLGLIGVDAAGNFLWSKYYDNVYSWQPNWGIDLIEDSYGDLVIATESTDGALGPSDAWMMKTDLTGNVIWSRKFDPFGGGTWQDGFHSVIETSCGYMASGWYNAVIGNTWDYALVHIDTGGYTGCEIIHSPTVTPSSHVSVSVVPITNTNIVEQNGGFTAASVGFSNESPCLLSFDVSADPVGPFCNSDSAINLTATYPNGSTYGTVNWSGPGITDPLLGTFDPSVAGVGNHEIVVQWPHICEERYDTIYIVVSEITINPTLTSPTCVGDCDGIIDILATSPWPIVDYSIDNGTTTFPTNVFNGECGGTYDIVVTDSLGCSDSLQITLVDPPPIDISLTIVDETCTGYCDGSIDITASGGTGALSYSIDGGGTFFPTDLFSPLCPALYNIVVQDANGCDSVTVANVAIASPVAPIITVVPSVCIGDPNVNLTATPLGGTWSGSGVIDPIAGIFDPAIAGVGANWIYYTDGCGFDSIQVTVNPLPDPTFTVSDTAGCSPFTVSFTSVQPSGASCVWDFGNGLSSNSCGTVSHTYISSGCYTVQLTVTENGCVASMIYPSQICVYPQPEAYFTFTPQNPDVEDTEVNFTNSSINASTFEWDFGDGSPLSNEIDPEHTYPTVPGSYTITLTATDPKSGCNDITKKLIIIDDVIIFYVPNAFSPDGDAYNNSFTPVFTSGFDPWDFHMTIFNRWGEIVFETYDASKGWNGHYGNGGLVQDGVYIWQIEFLETMSDKKHKRRGHVTILK